MNQQQAREILKLYRPGTADARDPDFAEALAFARQDAELARGLENHCANYESIRTRLKQIAVPAGLKEQILTERKTHTHVISIPRSSWWQPAFAVAAVIILLLGIASFWFHGADNHPAYRNRMVSTALRIYGMDLETNDLGQVRAFLAQKNAPSDYALPNGLQKLQCTGCVVLRWQDKPVSMICFRTGRPLASGEKSDLFLFVKDSASLSKVFPEGSRNLEQVNQVVTATWTEGGKTYLLATRGDEEFIRKFL